MSFRDRAATHCKECNPVIAEGIATTALADMVKLVEACFRAALCDPNGLEFDYIAHCDPRVEFEKEIFRRPNTASSIEMAVSDMRLMEIHIKHRGVPLKKVFYMKLWFARQYNFVMISGKMNQILAMIADQCITVVKNEIFVQFARAKFIVSEALQVIKIGDQRISQTIPFAKIHNDSSTASKPGSRGRSGPKPVLFLNLLAKYGLYEAFEISCGIRPVFINTTSETAEKEIAEYKAQGYLVVSSNGVRPGKIPTNAWAIPNIIAMIPENKVNIQVSICMASFFYLLERNASLTNTIERISSTTIWLVIMGLINMGDLNYPTLVNSMKNHIESVGRYLDEPSKKMFEGVGVYVEDTFELLTHIMLNAHSWISASGAHVASVTNKQLVVLSKIAEQITKNTFMLTFRYHQMVTKRNEPLTDNDAEKLCNDFLKRGLSFTASKSKLVRSASIVGDRRLPTLTRVVNPTRQGGGDRNIVFTPSDAAHSSLYSCMQVNYHPDGNPFGRAALNPFSGTGTRILIEPEDPEELELYRETNVLLNNKL